MLAISIPAPPCHKDQHQCLMNQLEDAITCYGSQDPVPAIRAVMQARLDAVTAEQDGRARIARA
jgi:hypothetical protein